jgi:signal transduction histidine kinase
VATPGARPFRLRAVLWFSAMIGVVNAQDGPGLRLHNVGMAARRLGWVLVIIGGVAMVATPVIGAWHGHLTEAARSAPQVVAFYLTGAFAFVLRPAHRAARRLLAFGALLAVANAAGTGYSAYLTAADTPGWGWCAVLVLQACDFAWFVLLFAVFVVFPDGEYQRQYERRMLGALAAALPTLLIMQLVGSARLSTTAFVWQDKVSAANPVAVTALAPLGAFASVAIQAGVLGLAAGLVILVLRYRRFGPSQRQQIAWPLYALALTVCFIALLGAFSSAVTTLPGWLRYVLFFPAVLPIPVSLVIGMLRYRLLDLDVVVRRSIVYGTLWLLIALGYIGLAAAFGVALGQRVPLDLAIVLTILATMVAAPIRHRLERLADRLVFGRRLSGYELISQLGDRLQSSPAPEDVAGTVAAAVQTGLGARWVRVTLNHPQPHTVAAAGVDPISPGEPVLHVPLVQGPDVVGALECGAKADGRYSHADQHLLETLGRQATLAIRNSQLTTELFDRVAELAASRARLVHAEEAGRRRLERDIHDGVQQELVAVLARLGLARNQLRRDASLAATTLREAQADGRRALETLQELVRGIHPPILTDRGLLEAVRERAARLPIPTQVSCDGLASGARFAPNVEGAAYFFICEALGNVLKHAAAGHVSVCFRLGEDGIVVQVRDDGRGFAIESVPHFGLRGLHDRIEALGGRVDMASTPGHGTTISAWLPTGEPS